MAQSYLGSRKNFVHKQFYGANLTNTNGTLLATADNQTIWIPRNASIVGFSGSLNAALTTGTLTFQATIDGSLCPAFTANLHTNQQASYQHLDIHTDNYILTAGQSLGVRYTSSDTVNPTTTDGVFTVELLLDDVNY